MKRCRVCLSPLSDARLVLCPRCRVLAGEKRKAAIRGGPEAAHLCLTEGCQSILEGKSLYCPECRYRLHLARQRRYRRQIKARREDLPPEPVTSLDWLKSFSGWAKSGLSYAEYQKAGWTASGNIPVEK